MSSKRTIYKKNEGDKVWWVDDPNSGGNIMFTFDKKRFFYLFRDYPDKLTVEEWEIFNKENPYWVEFFEDRNEEYEEKHLKEIAKNKR